MLIKVIMLSCVFLIRLQGEMEQLVGSLELYLILNYPIHLQLQPSHWVQEITFHLHLDGYVCIYTLINIIIVSITVVLFSSKS